MAHVVSVHKVDGPGLACADEQMRGRTVLVGQNDRSARAQVEVYELELVLVERREVVRDAQAAAGSAQSKETIPVVEAARGIGIEAAVASFKEDVTVRVHGRCPAGLPDSSEPGIWRGVKHADLHERARIVAQKPAVVGAIVAVR